MYKYIIYWIIVTVQSVPCDCNKEYTDEFGRVQQHSYAVYCTESTKEYKHKDFYSRNEAIEFYYKAKKEDVDLPSPPFSGLDSVKIDSVKIMKCETRP